LNCRKVSGLLSAYLDQELTGEEMLSVRAHLDDCALCRSEYQSLSDTKHLLASLALQTPRAELEKLLLCDAERSARPWPARLVPERVRDWFLVAWSSLEDAAAAEREAREYAAPAAPSGGLRLRPLAATALLSLAGLCLATAKLSGPHDESAPAMGPEVYGGYTSFVLVSPSRAVAVVPAAAVMSAPPAVEEAPFAPVSVPSRAAAAAASVMPAWAGAGMAPGSGPVMFAAPQNRWATAPAGYSVGGGGSMPAGAIQYASSVYAR
jgi:anti-sigma factor RsiW